MKLTLFSAVFPMSPCVNILQALQFRWRGVPEMKGLNVHHRAVGPALSRPQNAGTFGVSRSPLFQCLSLHILMYVVLSSCSWKHGWLDRALRDDLGSRRVQERRLNVAAKPRQCFILSPGEKVIPVFYSLCTKISSAPM